MCFNSIRVRCYQKTLRYTLRDVTLSLLMNTHTRPDSAVWQTRVSVPANDGSRSGLVRSLGTSDNGKASRVAASLQNLADAIPDGEWLHIKNLVEAVFISAGQPLPHISRDQLPILRLILPFVEQYLGRKREKSSKSHYSLLQRSLWPFARAHSSLELHHFKTHHVQAWLDALVVQGLSPGSVRNQLAALNSLFGFAVRQGFLSFNPCLAVECPALESVVCREGMAETDVERLLGHLRSSGRQDWLTAVLCMRYAGLRLVDACRLTGEAVSWSDGACLLTVTPSKTGKVASVPVFDPLASHLSGLCRSGVLCPSLANLAPDQLSRQFTGICDEAGIDGQEVTLPNGRKHRRVSAHGLRHSFCTDLAKRGIPESLRMRLSGHATVSSHRLYDHSAAMDIYNQVAPYFRGV